MTGIMERFAYGLRERAGLRWAVAVGALRCHSLKVWLLWAVGVIAILQIAKLDPGLLVYLYDPEALAGLVLFVPSFMRRSAGDAVLVVVGVLKVRAGGLLRR
jgi:hypothetical protein